MALLSRIRQMSMQVSRSSPGEYHADEQAGVTWLICLILASWCHLAQLASIRQMSRQLSRGSAVEYQADERASVAGLSWRESGLVLA